MIRLTVIATETEGTAPLFVTNIYAVLTGVDDGRTNIFTAAGRFIVAESVEEVLKLAEAQKELELTQQSRYWAEVQADTVNEMMRRMEELEKKVGSRS